MGEIRENDSGDKFYYADSGYVVPAKPKTRSVYNYETRKHDTLADYTLKDFVKAEKGYLQIKKFLNERYGESFMVVQPSPTNRITSIIPTALYEATSKSTRSFNGWWTWSDFALFTLSLQQGKVFNMPTTQLKSVFKIEFTNNVNDVKGGGNKGCSVEEALSLMNDFEVKARELFIEHGGHQMTSEHFAMLAGAFKLQASSVISFKIEDLIPYIVAGMTVENIAFGFNKRLLLNTSLACIPVEHVVEYSGLPIEWVERIIAK